MTNLDAAPEMLLPGPTGLFHCTGLPPALGPRTASTISRTSTWIPAHSGSSLLAFNLYRGSTCTSQSLTGVPALPCGCLTLRITLRGLQGLQLYSVLGWSPPPTRLARPVVSTGR